LKKTLKKTCQLEDIHRPKVCLVAVKNQDRQVTVITSHRTRFPTLRPKRGGRLQKLSK